jgi:osmotically-inducible protein OsmY
MEDADRLIKEVRAALTRDPRINLQASPFDVLIEGEKVVLQGEVEDIAVKRLAAERAARTVGSQKIEDRLQVRPVEALGDGAIRDFLWRHLSEEPVFVRMRLCCRVANDDDVIEQNPDDADGAIEATVRNGTIHLTGHVWSLSHRRLAGTLAWWTRGCRNVINELEIRPEERDHDGEISDAIELVLNKDPLVHFGQTTTRVKDGEVTLRGLVANEEEKRMIERDVWYVDGVRDVINELHVFQPSSERTPFRADRPSLE